jgi:hypothetical protein
MEPMNQFVTAETNKTAAMVVKSLEHLLRGGHTAWMNNFCNSPELTWFTKCKDRVNWNYMCQEKKCPSCSEEFVAEERRLPWPTLTRCGSSCMAR